MLYLDFIDPHLSNQVHGSVITSITLPSLEDIFNVVQHVSTSNSHLATTPALSPLTSTSLVLSLETSTLTATHTLSIGCGSGRDHGRSGRGHGGSCNSYLPCAHCGW